MACQHTAFGNGQLSCLLSLCSYGALRAAVAVSATLLWSGTVITPGSLIRSGLFQLLWGS